MGTSLKATATRAGCHGDIRFQGRLPRSKLPTLACLWAMTSTASGTLFVCCITSLLRSGRSSHSCATLNAALEVSNYQAHCMAVLELPPAYSHLIIILDLENIDHTGTGMKTING